MSAESLMRISGGKKLLLRCADTNNISLQIRPGSVFKRCNAHSLVVVDERNKIWDQPFCPLENHHTLSGIFILMPRKKEVRTETYSLVLPKECDAVITTIVDHDNTYKEKDVWKLKFKIALSSLIERCNEKGEEYIPVSMKVQAGILGVNKKNCCRIYKQLRDHQLVFIDKSTLVVGRKSYSYKPAYSELIVEEIKASTLNKKTEQAIKQLTDLAGELTETERKYLEVLKKVSVSKELADVVRENCSQDIKGVYTIRGILVPGETCYVEPPQVIPVLRIMQGQFKVYRPDKRSRIYSNITNLKRVFRKHLRLNGKPLIGLDISNSQPLLASIIFIEYSKKFYGEVRQDVVDYKASCEAGKFYEYFMELNGVHANERSQFKKEFFGKVFFTKEIEKENYLKTQFKERYPTCYEAIFNIKGGFYSKQYKDFAVALQRIEADIIVGVNMDLIEHGFDALNIFDSIYVTNKLTFDIVKALVAKRFSEFGITPKFNMEDYRSY